MATLFNSNQSENISQRLFAVYEKDIVQTRQKLFKDLKIKSNGLSVAANAILQDKISSSPGSLWGELYPWFISETLGINKAKTKQIAVGWLAIYLHTIYIDECIDSNKKLIKEQLLASSLLAKHGLLNLFKIVRGTKYEHLFNESIDNSANYELFDFLNQSNTKSLALKEEIAIGKNRIILACAGAFAACDSKNSNYIIEFTRSMLLTLQCLDDISDHYVDFNDGNYTLLLSSLNNSNFSTREIHSELDLLEKLIASNALLNTLNIIKKQLAKTMKILDSVKGKTFNDNSRQYFYLLNCVITDFIVYLRVNGGSCFINKSAKIKKSILDEVQSKIYICNVTT